MINVGKMLSEWSPTYSFMPLFPAPPVSAPEVRLTAQLEERLGTVRVKGDLPRLGNEDGCIFFELDECRVPVEGGDDGATVPSRLALMGGGRFKIDQWTDASSREQLQLVDDSKVLLAEANYYLLASNGFGSLLEREVEYGAIASFADAILNAYPDCVGFFWPYSQSMVSRVRWAHGRFGRALHFLDGGLNVRNYRLDGGGRLVDTVGLVPVGLPDVQVLCSRLGLEEACVFAEGLASYLFGRGTVICDGDAVEGPDGASWECRREMAAVGPERPVVAVRQP